MGRSLSLLLVGFALGAVVATVAFALLTGKGNSRIQGPANTVVLKLAHSLDQQHPVHLSMEFMAERLARKSGGQLVVEIAPNGQLGGETECVSLVQRGALALTKVSTAPLETFVPEFAVFSVPYIFDDEEHFWRVLDGELGAELLSAGEETGIRGLCYYDAGARSFYTVDRAILKPDDLRGLLIRVMESPTSMAMVEALGGSPTPVDFGELYTALQQGVVDGAENNPPSFYSNRHYEVCKEYSLDQHTRTPDILLISQKRWERLTPQQQTWVSEAADESAQYQRRLWSEKTAEALAEAEKMGVTIHHPDQVPFQESVKPMLASYDGTAVGDLIARIREQKASP